MTTFKEFITEAKIKPWVMKEKVQESIAFLNELCEDDL